MVFYNHDSYERFYKLYSHTVTLGSKAMEWTALVKLHSLRDTPEQRWAQWNAVRPMLAAMNILYYSLFGGSMSHSEWDMVVERNLLTSVEARQLQQYGGFKPFLPICWAIDEARLMVKEKALVDESLNRDLGQCVRDELVHAQFCEIAFEFRVQCGQIVNLLAQPVPFPYFHLLNTMLLIQLLLFGYALACTPNTNPYFGIIIMFLVSLVLVGLRGLAVQLSNPFGKDLVDFDIERFMSDAFRNTVALLKVERKPCLKHEPAGMSNPLLDVALPHSGMLPQRSASLSRRGKELFLSEMRDRRGSPVDI